MTKSPPAAFPSHTIPLPPFYYSFLWQGGTPTWSPGFRKASLHLNTQSVEAENPGTVPRKNIFSCLCFQGGLPNPSCGEELASSYFPKSSRCLKGIGWGLGLRLYPCSLEMPEGWLRRQGLGIWWECLPHTEPEGKRGQALCDCHLNFRIEVCSPANSEVVGLRLKGALKGESFIISWNWLSLGGEVFPVLARYLSLRNTWLIQQSWMITQSIKSESMILIKD